MGRPRRTSVQVHVLQSFFVSLTSQLFGAGISCLIHVPPSPFGLSHAMFPGRPPTSTMLSPNRVARGLAVPTPALMFCSGDQVFPESVDSRLESAQRGLPVSSRFSGFNDFKTEG